MLAGCGACFVGAATNATRGLWIGSADVAELVARAVERYMRGTGDNRNGGAGGGGGGPVGEQVVASLRCADGEGDEEAAMVLVVIE